VRAFSFLENTMVPTYMDRCDAASGYQPPQAAPDTEDPRYWNGALYNTVLDRMIAEAKQTLRVEIAHIHRYHATMVRVGFNKAFAQIGGRA
jgi:hypothetical protein